MKFPHASLLALLLPLHASAGIRVSGPGEAAKSKENRVFEITEGLSAPESVLHHEGVLYISNVAGQPTGKDGKGWIGKADLEGEWIDEKWVSGLHAPKGMGILDGKLYVTDIDRVVVVDLVSGKILDRIPVQSAQFLNDIGIDEKEKRVFVSDMTEGVLHEIDAAGKAKRFLEGSSLAWPNGLYVRDGKLFVASWGLGKPDWTTEVPGRILIVDLKTKKISRQTPKPLGNLDGLEPDRDGNWLVSDWNAGKIYRVDTQRGKPRLLYKGFKGSADIGYVPEKHLLIVPRMGEDAVSAYSLEKHRVYR